MTTQPLQHDVSVYIGRFQIFHNGQLALLQRALAAAPLCIVVLGSAHQARTPKNPFTWQERAEMIRLALSEADLDPSVMERELAVQTSKALEENAASAKPKPDAVIQNNVIPGRMKRFLSENTLMGQAFVMNPEITVAEAAKQAGVEVTGFVRMGVGEGIEKEKEDFAAEVAKMVQA